MWVSAANAKPGPMVPEPATEEELWTNVDYVIASTEASLARTHFAGDALPVFCPWLGPNQFAAWLGAELALKPRDFTSWVKPFVHDWDAHPQFRIAPDNRWWRLYLEGLGCIQWIQGAGQRPPSQWLGLLGQIQAAGKAVQLYYGGVTVHVGQPSRLPVRGASSPAPQACDRAAGSRPHRQAGKPALQGLPEQLHGGAHGGDLDLKSELDVLCRALDPNRLFLWAEARSAADAEAVAAYARKAARRDRA
jgi:hypothetical protein